VWIGDIAATVHMTPHAIGFIKNQNDKNKGQSITVGNGEIIHPILSLTCAVCQGK